MFRKMPHWETALWLVFCITCIVLWQHHNRKPGEATLGYYLHAAAVGAGIAFWVSVVCAPLRWWVALTCLWQIIWARWHELADGAPLPPLPVQDARLLPWWMTAAWLAAGLAGGYLYARWQGWRLLSDDLDSMDAIHCTFWGPMIGPPLLAFSLPAYLWHRAAPEAITRMPTIRRTQTVDKPIPRAVLSILDDLRRARAAGKEELLGGPIAYRCSRQRRAARPFAATRFNTPPECHAR